MMGLLLLQECEELFDGVIGMHHVEGNLPLRERKEMDKNGERHKIKKEVLIA
jgi:hypothetical protein